VAYETNPAAALQENFSGRAIRRATADLAYAYEGALYRVKGDRAKAKENFNASLHIVREIGAKPDVQHSLGAMKELR